MWHSSMSSHQILDHFLMLEAGSSETDALSFFRRSRNVYKALDCKHQQLGHNCFDFATQWLSGVHTAAAVSLPTYGVEFW